MVIGNYQSPLFIYFMAKKIFVISDTWFNRPFGEKSGMFVQDYNNEIIKTWNKCVNKHDIVYVLGGFGISELYSIVVQLNGEIHFLNNFITDDEISFKNGLLYSVENSIDKKLKNRIIFEDNQILTLPDNDVVLSYLPLLDWYGKNTGTFCFHGLNVDTNISENRINCNTLKWKFCPVSIEDVKKNINIFFENSDYITK